MFVGAIIAQPMLLSLGANGGPGTVFHIACSVGAYVVGGLVLPPCIFLRELTRRRRVAPQDEPARQATTTLAILAESLMIGLGLTVGLLMPLV